MKVQNMTSPNGNKVANQFILATTIEQQTHTGEKYKVHIKTFQSYNSVIIEQYFDPKLQRLITKLDSKYWDYSKTTAKYRNQFLNEDKKETQKKIDSGQYTLTNLNE